MVCDCLLTAPTEEAVGLVIFARTGGVGLRKHEQVSVYTNEQVSVYVNMNRC